MTQENRHVAIAIDRKFIRGAEAEADEMDEEDDDVHDLMAAHSTKLATARYAWMGGLTRSLMPESISIFRTISDKWQRWFKLPPRIPVDIPRIIRNEGATQPVTAEDKAQAALHKLYGPIYYSFREST